MKKRNINREFIKEKAIKALIKISIIVLLIQAALGNMSVRAEGSKMMSLEEHNNFMEQYREMSKLGKTDEKIKLLKDKIKEEEKKNLDEEKYKAMLQSMLCGEYRGKGSEADDEKEAAVCKEAVYNAEKYNLDLGWMNLYNCELFYRLGKYEDALESCNKAIKYKPSKNSRPPEEYNKIHEKVGLANAYKIKLNVLIKLRRNDAEEIIKTCNEIIKRDKAWILAYMMKGQIIYFLENYQEVVNIVQDGLRSSANIKESEEFELRKLKVKSLFKIGRANDGLKEIREMKKIKGYECESHRIKVELLRDMGFSNLNDMESIKEEEKIYCGDKGGK